MEEQFFTEKELAKRWSISIKTLQRYRQQNEGPNYMKDPSRPKGAVRYPMSEILTHESQNMVFTIDGKRTKAPSDINPPVSTEKIAQNDDVKIVKTQSLSDSQKIILAIRNKYSAPVTSEENEILAVLRQEIEVSKKKIIEKWLPDFCARAEDGVIKPVYF